MTTEIFKYNLKISAIKLTLLFLLTQCSVFGQQSRVDIAISTTDTNYILLLINSAKVQDSIGQYDSSIRIYSTIENISNKLKYKKGLFKAYAGAASAYFKLGKIEQSLDYNALLIELYQKNNNFEDCAIQQMLRGNLYWNIADYPNAISEYLKALKISEKIGNNSNIINCNIGIGNIYGEQGQSAKALEYYKIALKKSTEINDSLRIGHSYMGIGNVYESLNNLDEAMFNYESGLKIAINRGNKRQVGYINGNIGSLLIKRGLKYYGIKMDSANYYYNNAIVYLINSLQIFKALDNEKGELKKGIGEVEVLLAKSNYYLGNYKSAMEYVLNALKISEDINDLATSKEAYFYLSEIYRSTNQDKLALESFKKYTTLKDSLFNSENTKKVLHQQIQFEFDKKELIATENHNRQIALAESDKKRQRVIIYAISFGLLLLMILSAVVFRALQNNRRKNRIITEQKHLVEEKQKEILDSINYAERIQKSFLATKELLDENLNEYFVFFQPKDVVSGDFYWVSKLNNRQFALVTADSTGHGVPGAIMSLLNITSLERAIETESEPAAILNVTRKIIIERLKNDGSAEGGKDGMDCSLISFDFKNNKLTYAAANNPVWIVRENNILEFNPDKMPVGKHDKDSISFTQHEIELKKGDVVYALTDGMPDQFGGPRGKKYMYKQLKELLISISNQSMQEQKAAIKQSLENWKGDLEQVDDICIIGVRV